MRFFRARNGKVVWLPDEALEVTLFLLAGLAFHLSLMRGTSFRTWIARSASAADARQTARLHAEIFH